MNTCVNCGSPVRVISFTTAGGTFTLPPPKYCSKDECVMVAEEARALENPAPVRSNLDGCPELFKDTDPTRLPQTLRAVALGWDPFTMKCAPGLLIHGPTRKGKTRCMWYVRNRLKGMNRAVKVLTMFELEAELVSAWGKDRWDRAMKDMTEVEVLFLDDLGKEKMTERMASVLFALIDQRSQHKRPTLITTNHTGQSLLERFHDRETGAAFVARLKDPMLYANISSGTGPETPEML